jgi:SAM-dependent methyltransferase
MKPFSGSGPGVQTRDGCSVDLYRLLPYQGEVDLLRDHVSPAATILELGCGTGRLTEALLSLGCRVTAVDNSREMLAHAPASARLVLSDIESLNLSETFDVVILPTCLINHADATVRRAFLRAARTHVGSAGRFILERHDPHWLESATVGQRHRIKDVDVTVEALERAHGQIEMTLRYQAAGRSWLHSFTVVAIDEAQLQSLLSEAGFGRLQWLDPKQRWARTSPRGVD